MPIGFFQPSTYSNTYTFLFTISKHKCNSNGWRNNNQTKWNWFFVLGSHSNVLCITFHTFFVFLSTYKPYQTYIVSICYWTSNARRGRTLKSNILHTCRILPGRPCPFHTLWHHAACNIIFPAVLCLFGNHPTHTILCYSAVTTRIFPHKQGNESTSKNWHLIKMENWTDFECVYDWQLFLNATVNCESCANRTRREGVHEWEKGNMISFWT